MGLVDHLCDLQPQSPLRAAGQQHDDLANTSSLKFFDSGGSSLSTFAVPVSGTSDGSLSFLGVLFTTERIARVRIVSSNTAMGPTDNLGSGIDVVAMDDFLYASRGRFQRRRA